MDIKVPSVGESVTEGTITRWLMKNGESVQAHEPVCEIETDKATTEVSAPKAGLLHILSEVGSEVAVGDVIARVEQQDGNSSSDQKQSRSKERKKSSKKKNNGERRHATSPEGKEAPSKETDESDETEERDETEETDETEERDEEPILTPAARRLAQTNGIDARRLRGTGRGGRVTDHDVKEYLRTESLDDDPPQDLEDHAQNESRRQHMTPFRKRIAERLADGQRHAAVVTTVNEADMSAVQALRLRFKKSFRKQHGVSLGIASFFVKACVEALRVFPILHARIDGDDIVYPARCDIGVAVSTDKGLVVPVIKEADEMSFVQIEQRIGELARKARNNKLEVADLQGGTFTITNGGVFGSLLSTPLLNPPQSAILGLHAIQDRPVAREGQVVVRPMIYLALSYDHRLIDGSQAVQFLVHVKNYVESPERMALGL